MFHFDFQVCFWINETNRLDMDVGGFCQLSKLVWKMEKGGKNPYPPVEENLSQNYSLFIKYPTIHYFCF